MVPSRSLRFIKLGISLVSWDDVLHDSQDHQNVTLSWTIQVIKNTILVRTVLALINMLFECHRVTENGYPLVVTNIAMV